LLQHVTQIKPTNFYEAWNKAEKAEEWRAKLPQTEDIEK
jgi:hypothetical protein